LPYRSVLTFISRVLVTELWFKSMRCRLRAHVIHWPVLLAVSIRRRLTVSSVLTIFWLSENRLCFFKCQRVRHARQCHYHNSDLKIVLGVNFRPYTQIILTARITQFISPSPLSKQQSDSDLIRIHGFSIIFNVLAISLHRNRIVWRDSQARNQPSDDGGSFFSNWCCPPFPSPLFSLPFPFPPLKSSPRNPAKGFWGAL